MTNIKFEEPDPQEEMAKDAETLAKEILETGKATLKSGRKLEFDPKDLLRHIQWAAGRGVKKPVKGIKIIPREAHAKRTE